METIQVKQGGFLLSQNPHSKAVTAGFVSTFTVMIISCSYLAQLCSNNGSEAICATPETITANIVSTLALNKNEEQLQRCTQW
jgi:hypothetical protein